MTKFSGFGHVGLAIRKELCLPRDLGEVSDDLLVTTVEIPDGIGDPHVFAELDHQLLSPTEIVARNARVKVMDRLMGNGLAMAIVLWGVVMESKN